MRLDFLGFASFGDKSFLLLDKKVYLDWVELKLDCKIDGIGLKFELFLKVGGILSRDVGLELFKNDKSLF